MEKHEAAAGEDANPGSPEAVANGCTCPRMDNANGRGAWGTGGSKAVFWITEDCPLHGPASD